MERKEKNKILIIVFLFVLAVALFIVSIFDKGEVLDVKEFPVRIELANVTGLKVDESLDFGRIIHNANGLKKINIVNNHNFPVVAEFSAEGEVKDFLVYEEKVYFLPLENKTIPIATIIFKNESYKEYFGTLKVVLRRAD